ncbi:MAG: urea transporter [Alistipes indistinctus]
MFQNNALFGVLMLSGIAISNWRAAILALAGNIAGNLTAIVPLSGQRDRRQFVRDLMGHWSVLPPAYFFASVGSVC